MSAHNHGEEIIRQNFGRTKTAKALDKKVRQKQDEIIREVIFANFDKVSGMEKIEAVNFLVNAIDEKLKK